MGTVLPEGRLDGGVGLISVEVLLAVDVTPGLVVGSAKTMSPRRRGRPRVSERRTGGQQSDRRELEGVCALVNGPVVPSSASPHSMQTNMDRGKRNMAVLSLEDYGMDIDYVKKGRGELDESGTVFADSIRSMGATMQPRRAQ